MRIFKLIVITALSVLLINCKKKNKNSSQDSVNPDVVVENNTSSTTLLSKLVINLTGMKNATGNVSVALYNSESSFNDPNNAYKKIAYSAVSGSMQIIITDLPAGTYAFGLFHDENTNNEIDKNLLGIPKEGFAFSNNAMGSFGPPSYESSKFNIPEKSTVTQGITLKFY